MTDHIEEPTQHFHASEPETVAEALNRLELSLAQVDIGYENDNAAQCAVAAAYAREHLNHARELLGVGDDHDVQTE